MKVEEAGEDGLLARLFPSLPTGKEVIAGAGDDCAVVRPPGAGRLLLLKTDCVVEGIHFSPRTAAAAIGWKAMMRPLSDFAAMAGVPQFALITLIVPGRKTAQMITTMYRSLKRAANRFEVAVVGGETSRSNGPLTVSVSVAGWVEKDRWVSRTGGKAGDELFVTGRLGGSLAGKHLNFVPRIHEARWLTQHFRIHAMMDLSDGLGADLPRLARASSLGYEIDPEVLPRNRGCSVTDALSNGEDYELLFAAPPTQSLRLEASWRRRFRDLPLTRIGSLVRSPAVQRPKLTSGYFHFKKSR